MQVSQEAIHKETFTNGLENHSAGNISRKDAMTMRYAPAVGLYADGDRSISEIADLCGLRISGLAAHISRYHHDLALLRYGISKGVKGLAPVKARLQAGQSRATHLKYRRAIEACSDIVYIEFNVPQLARLFRLNSSSLMQQLKAYYPEVIEQREKIRRKLGIAARGPRKETAGNYAEAFDMFRDTDLGLTQVAERCNVSRCGFSRFMRCYHSDLVKAKEESKRADRLLLKDRIESF